MKQRIWDDLHDAGRLSRYYGVIASRNRRWHLGLSFLAVFGSIAAGTILLLEKPPWWGATLFLGVATITAMLAVFDYSRTAQIARSIGDQLREIETELMRLWYRSDAEDVTSEVESIERRISSVSREDIPIDYRLNQKCSDDAYAAIKDFYGSEPDRATTATTATTT